MKRVLIGVCLTMLAFGSVAQADVETTQTGSYVFSGWFVEDCDLGASVACFSIFRSDLSTVRVEVNDAVSPFSITAHVSVLAPGGGQILSTGQFCDAADIALPQAPIAQIVVHVGGFSQDECGPVPFHDPIEDKDGWLTPITTGSVTITYH